MASGCRTATKFIQRDFAEIARNFGCLGLPVDRHRDPPDALDEASCSGLAAVIDVRHRSRGFGAVALDAFSVSLAVRPASTSGSLGQGTTTRYPWQRLQGAQGSWFISAQICSAAHQRDPPCEKPSIRTEGICRSAGARELPPGGRTAALEDEHPHVVFLVCAAQGDFRRCNGVPFAMKRSGQTSPRLLSRVRSCGSYGRQTCLQYSPSAAPQNASASLSNL